MTKSFFFLLAVPSVLLGCLLRIRFILECLSQDNAKKKMKKRARVKNGDAEDRFNADDNDNDVEDDDGDEVALWSRRAKKTEVLGHSSVRSFARTHLFACFALLA